jgi:hypothetical protein
MASSSNGSGKRGCMWIFWALVAVLLLPCAGVFSIWASRQSRDGKILKSMIEELKKRGAPIDNESLLALSFENRSRPVASRRIRSSVHLHLRCGALPIRVAFRQ